jgi:cyclopropane fatty-acyl-phospholipid synthase-like methyltransferase
MDERSVPNHEEVIRIDTYIAATDDPIEDNDHYKGLRIHSVKGLHEFVAGKILETFPPGSTVLDLGSGTGAMSLRLSDIGFRVTAADIVPENFKLHGKIPFRNVNLNDTFSHSFDSRFKGIVAIEIIEHLENPRRFLRECYKLLSPGGVFVMSTPNIDNPISKASFVRDGTFQWYLDFDYEHQGHIMPISQWLLRKCITESGFDLLWMGSFGDPFANMEGWWKIRFFALLLRFVSKTDRSLNGEIMVVVLRKPAGAK